MLGKQRKNQVTDLQFMDAAWKNMAEILDKEMPVEKEERRIGWLSIAAILVMGFVGGITVMWGLQKHQVSPMAANHTINNSSKANSADTEFQQEENLSLTTNNTAYNSNTTLDKTTTISNSEMTISNSLLATKTKKEQLSKRNISNANSYAAQKNLAQKSLIQNTAIVSNRVDQITSQETIAIIATPSIVFNKNAIDLSTPLSELPTLGLATLPAINTEFSIDNDIDLPKNKKWRTGIYAGAIVAGTTGNGVEAGWRVERKLGAKWAVETGLGFRATQIAVLNKNVSAERSSLDDNFSPNLVTTDPDSVADREMANNIYEANANKPNYQLTVPLSLVFKPTGKLRLALGMSWAYRLNKLKDASSRFVYNNASGETSNDSVINSFPNRLENVRFNFGVGYYLNPRTGIELAYAKRLSAKGKSDLAIEDSGDASASFFQIGVTHYFGK